MLQNSFLFSSLFACFLLHRAVAPSVKAVNQLVGAPVESHVLLQCIVEAYAKPLNTWYRNEGIVSLPPNLITPQPAMMSRRIFSSFQLLVADFFSIYCNDLNFSLLFLSSHPTSLNPRSSTNSICRQFIPRQCFFHLSRIVYHNENPPNACEQTPSCIMERNILLPRR
jgi:hypothetical protein